MRWKMMTHVVLSFSSASHPESQPLLSTAATWRAVSLPSLEYVYDSKLGLISAPGFFQLNHNI